MDTICAISRYEAEKLNMPERLYQTRLAEALLRKLVGDVEIFRPLGQKPYCLGFEMSISHSAGVVAVALSDVPIGVDIEKIRQPRIRAAKRLFTEAELAVVDSRFWDIWTRKEAYGKAQGRGLYSKLAQFDTLNDLNFSSFIFEDFICCVYSPKTPDFIVISQSELVLEN